MSVFTILTMDELTTFLDQYAISDFKFYPVDGGTQNTNYRIETNSDIYLLTLYEKPDHHALTATMQLVQHLAQHGFPTNEVLTDQQGKIIQTLHEKPCVLLRYLPGNHPVTLNLSQLHHLGSTIATLHQLTENLKLSLSPTRDEQWRHLTFNKVKSHLNASQCKLAEDAFARAEELNKNSLTSGIIHSDIFFDNLLFENDCVSGVIDFFDATHGILLYDVAIAAIDSCCDEEGKLITEKAQALLQGYQTVRALSSAELKAWPALFTLATLSFWLLRLHNQFFPNKGLTVKQKRAESLEKILRLQ